MSTTSDRTIEPLYLWFFFTCNILVVAGALHLLKISLDGMSDLETALTNTVRQLIIISTILTFIYSTYSLIKLRRDILSKINEYIESEESYTPLDQFGRELTGRERIQFITQEMPAEIIQDILGHPKKSPTISELEYMNSEPDWESDKLENCLSDLMEIDVIEPVSSGENPEGDQLVFYKFTGSGRDFLDEHNLFVSDEDELETEYRNVEKPPEIEELQNHDRP